jgi:hypothetical protein
LAVKELKFFVKEALFKKLIVSGTKDSRAAPKSAIFDSKS